MHGTPVQGHMNITFTYYYHGMEDVLYEERMVGSGSTTENQPAIFPGSSEPIRSSSLNSVFQIDGEADFLFDVPDYHLMYRRSIEMSDYGSYMEDQVFVSILVHVTDHLTGEDTPTTELKKIDLTSRGPGV